MKKAVFGCILLALAWPRAIGAQAVDEYQGEFAAGADETVSTSAGEGPQSIAQAKKEHRGYRIGGKGLHAAALPEGKDVHVVSDGDTLWDISSHYFGEPWHWPELWSYNPEITNPHWIYPLDQIRLTSGALTQDQSVAKLMGGQGGGAGGAQEGKATAGLLAGTETMPSVVVPRGAWKPGMIFLRDQGYLDKDALRTVGQIIGGNEEQMFLSPSDQVYIKFGPNQDVRPGDSYTVFRAMEGWERVEKEKGTLVRILGTTVVRSYDKDKHVARGLVSEALDPIERGLFVAKLDRRFDLVEPTRNTSNVVAHIIATVQPHTLLADGSVVFLDVGEGHGIQPGNRFFVVRRGDEWLAALHTDAKDFGNVVDIPKYDPNLLPKEVVAELRVVKVRKSTTIAIITRSELDAMIGDTAEMRVGF
jgi:hypothetical protein